MKSIDETISQILNGRKGIFSIMARDLETGEEISVNPRALMPTASVFKVSVLVEIFRKAHLGLINLEQRHELTQADKSPGSGILKELLPGVKLTVGDLAVLMIIISDNTATDLCMNFAGA